MLNRGLLSLGFFILGLNGIYFGCIESASNNRRNPIWGLISGFVDFEKLILGGIAIVIGISIVGQTIIWILEKIERHKTLERVKISIAQEQFEPSSWITREMPPICYREADRFLPKAQIEIAKPEPNPFLCEEYLIPQKPKPTASELKQKALADILGR